MSWHSDDAFSNAGDDAESIAGTDAAEGENEQLFADTEAFTRDAICFLIDARLSMTYPTVSTSRHELQINESSSSSSSSNGSGVVMTSPLQQALTYAAEIMRLKIISADQDRTSLVFWGCEKTKNTTGIESVYSMQDLEVPSADRIKAIETWARDPTSLGEAIGFGAAGPVRLTNALYVANMMFNRLPKAWDYKRVFLFTADPKPCVDSDVLRMEAKVQDGLDSGISYSVFLLGPATSDIPAAMPPFWHRLLSKRPARLSASEVPDALEDDEVRFTLQHDLPEIDKMIKAIRKKPLSTVPLLLSPQSSSDSPLNPALSLALYALVRKVSKPKTAIRERASATAVSSTTEYIDATRGVAVTDMAQSGGKLYTYVSATEGDVAFLRSELALLRFARSDEPQICLIGFKSADSVKRMHVRGHGVFAYPSEKRVRGSVRAFVGLLRAMEAQNVVGIGRLIRRQGSSTTWVALIPQKEVLPEVQDGEDDVIVPGGLAIVPIGTAEEIRSLDTVREAFHLGPHPLPSNRLSSAAPGTKEAATVNLIRHLLVESYEPGVTHNPGLARFRDALTHRALAHEGPPPTAPDDTADMVSRLAASRAQFVEEFMEKALPFGYAPEEKKSTSTTRKRVVPESGEDLASVVASEGVLKFTVEQLKEMCRGVGVSTAGRKNELVERLRAAYAEKTKQSSSSSAGSSLTGSVDASGPEKTVRPRKSKRTIDDEDDEEFDVLPKKELDEAELHDSDSGKPSKRSRRH